MSPLWQETEAVALGEVSGEAEGIDTRTRIVAKNEPRALSQDSAQDGAGGLWV